jgi:hypothetical protein
MTDQHKTIHAAFRLNFEQQKKLAKDLLKVARTGNATALRRVRKPAAEVRLADAQLAIARELGFRAWRELKAHIGSMERERADIRKRRGRAPDGDFKTLHIRCGSDIKPVLAEAGFTGDFLEHAYPYCQGPVHDGPGALEERAKFLTDSSVDSPTPFDEMLSQCRDDESKLQTSARDYHRIVLWTEHDSYDQLALVRYLAEYATGTRPQVLELVATSAFPGTVRFLGLGQLPAEALRLLWERRKPVTPAQLAVGAEAWNALTAGDPRKLASIMKSRARRLPHLTRALHRHLQELPSLRNGLGLTQHLILQILSERHASPAKMFRLLLDEREPLPWLGDTGFQYIIESMRRAGEAVFDSVAGRRGDWERDELAITELGREVLTGARDWMSLRPLVRWVGGVQVGGGAPDWRWNDKTHEPELVR